MKIFTHLQIGDHHTNYCEDYLLTAQLTDHHYVAAVMDGCSSGTDSYLPSTITGRLIRKIAKEYYYRSYAEQLSPATAEALKFITAQLFTEWRYLSNYLMLGREELLNTLILAVINTQSKEAEILCVGDGVVCIDGIISIFEQDNRPDYLGYHLKEDFEKWWSNQYQFLSGRNVRDISLSTDGILSFSPFTKNKEYKSDLNIPHFLLLDNLNPASPSILHTKMIEIEEDYGLRPTDDIGIVRLLME